jgi:hypothetical protein
MRTETLPTATERLDRITDTPAFRRIEETVVKEDRAEREQQRRLIRASFDEWREAAEADLQSLNQDIRAANEAMREAELNYRDCKSHAAKLAVERRGKASYLFARTNALGGQIRGHADPKLREFLTWLDQEHRETREKGQPDRRIVGVGFLPWMRRTRTPDTIHDYSRVQRRLETLRAAISQVETALELPLSVDKVDQLITRLRASIPRLPQ